MKGTNLAAAPKHDAERVGNDRRGSPWHPGRRATTREGGGSSCFP